MSHPRPSPPGHPTAAAALRGELSGRSWQRRVALPALARWGAPDGAGWTIGWARVVRGKGRLNFLYSAALLHLLLPLEPSWEPLWPHSAR
jgi:hypothetical protein